MDERMDVMDWMAKGSAILELVVFCGCRLDERLHFVEKPRSIRLVAESQSLSRPNLSFSSLMVNAQVYPSLSTTEQTC
jgi:intergrase/recombinase